MRGWSPGWIRAALVLGGGWETPLPVCSRAQRLRVASGSEGAES